MVQELGSRVWGAYLEERRYDENHGKRARERIQHDRHLKREREFFIDNLLVRIHFIIVMIRWTGLVPWEFGFPFPGSLTSALHLHLEIGVEC